MNILTMTERRESGASILVTGAAGGIGLAIVRRMASDGWNIIATDLPPVPSGALLATMEKFDKISFLSLDVGDEPSVERVIETSFDRPGGVAALANVAGILQNPTPLFQSDLATQRKLWNVNYFGAVACTTACAERMADAGGGAIVNITSINEMRPLPLYAYAPAKAALGSFTQIAAGELAAYNVRVNAIAPGFTLTPLFQEKIERGERDPEALQHHTAMDRLVQPGEVADAFAFLVSDGATAITGVSLPVDAGWLATSHWMAFRNGLRTPLSVI